MKDDISKKYDLRVPRYTSYPTAPHFNNAVDGDTYRKWLGELDPSTPLSLYFHIPFCDSMCWFCGCYTKIVKRYEPVKEYLDVMLNEIDLVADALNGRFKAKHIHWGGGSPTMLKGSDWLRTTDKLRSRFDIDATAEIAVELDPRTASENYIKALAKAGVNRASIGVQGFHHEVQQAINRIQPFELTQQVVGWLRKHGINNINMDLLYGLPHQNEERVQKQAEMAASLNPVRIALFGYAHVPWMKSNQKMIDEKTLPDTNERWRQFVASSKELQEHGYLPVGLDHFALPTDELAIALSENRLHRNFQGYTTDEAQVMLGFGASAIGHLPQGYAQNTAPLKDYSDAIAQKTFPITRGIALNNEDRLRGYIIERLMCDFCIDLDDALTKHQDAETRDFAKEITKLAPLADDGIIDINGTHINITEDGRPFLRIVAAVFDTYLDIGEKRHSKAV